MQNLIKFFVVAVAVVVSGCMSVGGVLGYRTLQADIAKGDQANAEYIRSIVSADMDLKTALNKIYTKHYQDDGPYRAGKVLSEKHYGGLTIDTGIFKTLCDIKNGSLYRWKYPPNIFLTCEINGQVEIALAIEPKAKEPAARELYYDTRKNFDDYLQRQSDSFSNFTSYKSKNGDIQIARSGRDEFHLTLNYINDGKAPKSVDLTNSHVISDGAKYIIKFRDSNNDTHLVLNPNQSIKRGFVVDIPGLKCDWRACNVKIVIDQNIVGDSFESSTLYDRGKQQSNGRI